jgi:inosine-uridine nucleoside N-ribohydrolase
MLRGDYEKTVAPLVQAGSPLAEWMSAFMTPTFQRIERLYASAELSLHDLVCVWYTLTAGDSGWTPTSNSPEDIRIETTGQWTKGMCILDRRGRRKTEWQEEAHTDHGLWLSSRAGNRIICMKESPSKDTFGQILLGEIMRTQTK